MTSHASQTYHIDEDENLCSYYLGNIINMQVKPIMVCFCVVH